MDIAPIITTIPHQPPFIALHIHELQDPTPQDDYSFDVPQYIRSPIQKIDFEIHKLKNSHNFARKLTFILKPSFRAYGPTPAHVAPHLSKLIPQLSKIHLWDRTISNSNSLDDLFWDSDAEEDSIHFNPHAAVQVSHAEEDPSHSISQDAVQHPVRAQIAEDIRQIDRNSQEIRAQWFQNSPNLH